MSAPRHFDGYLESFRSEDLKSMARRWAAGRAPTRKDDCVVAIRQGLADAGRVRAVLARLDPFERNALALARLMGGAVDPGALGLALCAAGTPPPPAHRLYVREAARLITPLVRSGLFLAGSSSEFDSMLSEYYGQSRGVIFSDDRLLAHVGLPEYQPLGLKPVARPRSVVYRSPPVVLLDLVGIWQALETIGGMSLTQSGTVRVNDVRKLQRAMGWHDEGMSMGGLTFPNPGLAFVSALREAGLLVLKAGALVPSEPVEQFAIRPYADQVRPFLNGFLRTAEWIEWRPRSWFDSAKYRVPRGRLMLLAALAALPDDPDAFFAIDDFDQALFDRVGEFFTLGYPTYRPHAFDRSPAEVRREEEQWWAKLRTDWLTRERCWIQAALSSWLSYLGVIELGLEGKTPVCLRLTDLGRAVLGLESTEPVEAPASEDQAAWVVQPNFELLVYLDRAKPEQLAFLERHAERVQAHQHTAQYRLTRESVYRGLEGGTSLDDLLARLQDGASVAVPQNVEFEIREWAALREQITLRRQARLLEFADGQARQVALQSGVAGVPVGERFLLLAAAPLAEDWIAERVDYARPLPRCLVASEDGVIYVISPTNDLLLEGQLDQWAERRPRRTWQLTAASVSAAVKAGASVGALFKLLQERLTGGVPQLLAVALRAWAGEKLAVDLASVTVLRCPQPAVFQALRSSQKLRPFLRGELAPDLFLVDSQAVEALRTHLAWAGLEVSDSLEVKTKIQP